MIPRSIALRGFLCYKDEQTIDLDGCDLWVLAGRNGSGKSAIFDALTFALFKAHRGGKQKAVNLIHTEAAELTVCFEFDLGPDRYRIKRTVSRAGSADRGLYRYAPQPDGVERWPAVPGAQSDDGLERWVRENLGLTYETFTASVLLLQGQSDRLLGARPAARFEIVAGIVDLESYQRLHKMADGKRQQQKGLAETLRIQLQAQPAIEPVAIEQAESRLAEAEKSRVAAEAEWKQLLSLEMQASTWLDLVSRRQKAAAQGEHARQLLADSETIARDWSRVQELEAILPAVRQAIARREAVARVEAEAQSGEAERKTLSRQLDLIATQIEENRRHREMIETEIGRDEARVRAILEQLPALTLPIYRAGQARTLGQEIRRLEAVLTSFPADLAARVADLEKETNRRVEWKTALPSLTTLDRERSQLAEARSRQLAAQRAIEANTVEASQAEATLAECRAEESTARSSEVQARDRKMEAITLAQAAEDRLAQFADLDGSRICDRCGQQLTPEHFATEAARLRADRDRAVLAAQEATRAHRAARDRLDAAEAARAQAEPALQGIQEVLRTAKSDLAQAGREADRCARACHEAYESLNDLIRIRVAAETPDDWGATTFPEASDLAEGRKLAAEIGKIQSRWQEARAQLDQMEAAWTQLEQARHTLATVGLEPGDEAADAESATLQAERESLDHCLQDHATEKDLTEQTQARLDQHSRDLGNQLIGTERQLTAVQTRLETLRDEETLARATAPEGWRPALDTATAADLATWDAEFAALQTRDLKTLAAELPRALWLLGQARSDLDDLERQIAALPQEARRHPEELTLLTAQAEQRRRQADAVRQVRSDELNALRQAQDQRLDLQTRSRTADRDLAIAETLARLLGPRGLQRDLIREAERGIVALANPILREISGGELELQLLDVGDDQPDHALQLEAIERIQGRTGSRGVEYLSGSQKFRVAVSLALAIGQYARGSKERPIESVIIDEGFGSLDRQGRDEMIEQLTALRGRLARIILVSHQEEFAEAFRDGYHFEVIEGSTVARPFHR